MSVLVMLLLSNSGDKPSLTRPKQSGPDMDLFKWLLCDNQTSSLLRGDDKRGTLSSLIVPLVRGAFKVSESPSVNVSLLTVCDTLKKKGY